MAAAGLSRRERPNKLLYLRRATPVAICGAYLRFEMRLLFAILVLAFLALSTSRADLLDDAMLAHRAGVPEVSITKLRIFLASNAAPDQAEAANILLARCLIETQKTREASEALEHAKGPEAEFLRAQEALRSRRWKEAIDRFALLL